MNLGVSGLKPGVSGPAVLNTEETSIITFF